MGFLKGNLVIEMAKRVAGQPGQKGIPIVWITHFSYSFQDIKEAFVLQNNCAYF